MTDVLVSVGVPTSALPKLEWRPGDGKLESSHGPYSVSMVQEGEHWIAEVRRGDARMSRTKGLDQSGVMRSVAKVIMNLMSIEKDLGSCKSCGGVTHPRKMIGDEIVLLDKSKVPHAEKYTMWDEIVGDRTGDDHVTKFRGRVIEIRKDQLVVRLLTDKSAVDYRCHNPECKDRGKRVSHS
jgi:hypothetical protein